MQKEQTRDLAVDFVKCAAIFGVAVIHLLSPGYQNPIGSFDWWSSIFWGSITRASVPLFFLCSGVLFLRPEKELPLKKLYTRYLPRLLVSMLVWAMLYRLYHLAEAGALSAAAVWGAVKDTLMFRQEGHLYYLQIALLFYAMLPVVRAFLQGAGERDVGYALLLWLILGIGYPTLRQWPPFSQLTGIPLQWLMNMTYASVGYGLLGFWLKRHPPGLKWCLLLMICGFLFIFCGTAYGTWRRGSLYPAFLEGMTLGPATLAAGIFGTIDHLCNHMRSERKFSGGGYKTCCIPL